MWNKERDPPGGCVDMTRFWVSSASLNIIGDFIVYVLPIRTLWKVQLPMRERIGIVAVFAAGDAAGVLLRRLLRRRLELVASRTTV